MAEQYSDKIDLAEIELISANIREVCKTNAGLDIINEVLGMCQIYHNSFTGNSHTFFNEGRRSVGLEILEKLNEADPTIYIRILQRNMEKDNG